MKNHLIIDTSVYFNYIFYNKMYRLINAIIQHELTVYINRNLEQELYRNIPKALKKSAIDIDPMEIIDLIKSVTFYIETTPSFKSSPDPKDNFLFDLALQTQSDAIVTKEKALLEFINSPVEIHDIKWFKERFIVDL